MLMKTPVFIEDLCFSHAVPCKFSNYLVQLQRNRYLQDTRKTRSSIPTPRVLSLSPPHICPLEAVRMVVVVGTMAVVVVISVLAQNLLLLEGVLSCLLPLFQIYCFNLFRRFPHTSPTFLCPTSVSTCL